ncbi:MAG: putative metal-binding motif-containing protein [Candidatus Aenigmatarchaeota archaeon]
MNTKFLLINFLIFSILFSTKALAITIPCRFFGTVTVEGNPANASLVTAHLNDTGEYLGTAEEPPAGFGNYKIDLEATGKYVRFKIANVWVNEPEQYCDSGNYVYLNLSVSCSDCDEDGYNFTVDCDDSNPNVNPGANEACNDIDDDCDGIIDNFTESCYTGPEGTLNKGICKAGSKICLNGVWGACLDQVLPQTETCNGKDDDCDGNTDEGVCGGGGGGGGGISILPPQQNQSQTNQTENITERKEEIPKTCEENWVCSDWSECLEGTQTRLCEDLNKCGTTKYKPPEYQVCEEEKKEEAISGAEGIGITGMFLLITQNPVYLWLLFLIVVTILILLFRIKLAKKKNIRRR